MEFYGDNRMNIAGLIVHSHPHKTAFVKEHLETMPGVEVHAVTENGRIVLTVEEDDSNEMTDIIMRLHNVNGVLSAAMIYHHYEECGLSQKEA